LHSIGRQKPFILYLKNLRRSLKIIGNVIIR